MRSTILSTMLAVLVACIGVISNAAAQNEWPRTIITADGGAIRIYQPQPDSFRENILQFSAAFSFTPKGKDAAEFGAFTALSMVDIDKDNRRVNLLLTTVLSLHFSIRADSAKMEYLKEAIECGSPAATIDIPLDEIICFLDPGEEEGLPQPLNNQAPAIIVASQPTTLVLIDGIPRLRRNRDWGLNVVANSPFTIVQSEDGWFYLYGGRHWYLGPTPTGPYNHTTYIAPDLHLVQDDINDTYNRISGHTDTVREGADFVADIIVRTSPAELIQTRGRPVFAAIPGTGLLYISNTGNDLFLDTLSHLYFALLSGRWFKAADLAGPWAFTPPDALPDGFARIGEGSPKDRVLACVPGTAAAREALTDARLPQTAIILRARARTRVSYDGNPAFADIRGTHLQYARNASIPVLRYRSGYFSVDKGVWFQSDRPGGPWTICTERPPEVDLIPPDCPVYNCSFVHIYGTTPDYIYTGYTSGYLNAFAAGPTVVYGTGYYYPSWTGNTCYPQPWTWGSGIWYNPWFGWSLGYNLSLDWFNTGAAWGEGYWTGGWWGPPSWHPPYVWHHFSGHGFYEKDIRRAESINYSNNLYRERPDLLTRPPAEIYYTDGEGAVYRKDEKGRWWERAEDRWQPLDPNRYTTIDRLNRQQRLRQRAGMRTRNFRQQRG